MKLKLILLIGSNSKFTHQHLANSGLFLGTLIEADYLSVAEIIHLKLIIVLMPIIGNWTKRIEADSESAVVLQLQLQLPVSYQMMCNRMPLPSVGIVYIHSF